MIHLLTDQIQILIIYDGFSPPKFDESELLHRIQSIHNFHSELNKKIIFWNIEIMFLILNNLKFQSEFFDVSPLYRLLTPN